MTRGRKKDLTIPPTRALTQQRDYRARKAQYLADLEERCLKAEEENMQLKKRIEALEAQNGISAAAMRFSPEMVHTTTELMQHVAAVQASLVNFQQVMIARPAGPGTNVSAPSAASSTSAVHPNNLLSVPSAAFQLPPTPPALSPQTLAREVLASLPHLTIPPAVMPTPDASTQDERETRDWQNNTSSHTDRSESPMSECCGGIMDCTGLIESEDESTPPRRGCHQKTSEIRSTFGGSDRPSEAGPSTSRPGSRLCC
ncbi:hypothetical protein OE88DRAFT_1654927 [Heliocybe sulcata]|uniref:BZIP domain-containing protein n=1 Tax=Heliocybe sulcata TaxID=5364 RepID=A0A5C3NAD1_9AGAM|nr:hypothetical protein OE88DRAFT_1654927 [Heliocybe sulcata]